MTNFDTDESKKLIRKKLTEGPLQIVFIKKDGSERTMNCTLHEDYLPVVQKELNEDSITKVKSQDALAVYDIDVQGWRSFRWDSITAVNWGA